MVLCVNESLKMGKGKIGAQCAHAAVGAVQVMQARGPRARAALQDWEMNGAAKIALKVTAGIWVHSSCPERLTTGPARRHRLDVHCCCCLQVSDDDELRELRSAAVKKGLNCYQVADAGRTQVSASPATARDFCTLKSTLPIDPRFRPAARRCWPLGRLPNP